MMACTIRKNSRSAPHFCNTPKGIPCSTARAQHFIATPQTHASSPTDMTRDENWRKLRAQYLGNVKIVDDAIGEMVRALRETGQMENTIFAFTSDHGEMAGDHRMWEKRAFYDESARVPLLLSVPWLGAEQTHVDGVFGHADLIPTLLDLADVPIPDAMSGRECGRCFDRGPRFERSPRIYGMERHWGSQFGHSRHQSDRHATVALRGDG